MVITYAGMIYVFEFVILLAFDAYEYKPHILPIPYYDNALGAVVSNMFVVPVAAMLIAVFRLRLRGVLLFAFGIGGIEWLFLRLHVYEEHWWRIGYTIPSLVMFFCIAKLWLRKLNAGRSGYVFISLWMAAWSLVGTLIYALALTGVRTFHSGIFENVYRDDLFVAAIYGVTKAFILSRVVVRYRGLWPKAGGLAIILALNILLIRLDILKLHVALWQYWLIYVPCCLIVLWLVWLSHRSLRGLAKPS